MKRQIVIEEIKCPHCEERFAVTPYPEYNFKFIVGHFYTAHPNILWRALRQIGSDP